MASISHADRLRKLRAAMKARGLDAFLVLDRVNTRYLSGFTGSHSIILIDARQARFITDSRYAEIAAGMIDRSFKVICQPPKGTADFLRSLFKGSGYKAIGFEESITFQQYEAYKGYARGGKLVPAQDLILDLRAVKDGAELAIIRRAARLADDMMALALKSLRVGMTELELSRIIRRGAEDLGGEEESFKNIVASGPNASKPHHRGSNRRIRRGDMVTIDLGGVYKGYCSDLTRTVCVGPPGKRFEHIYNVCLAANEAAIRGIRPGMRGEEADALAREVIVRAGLGEYFGHGLGHGVGLEIHEAPRLSMESKAVLKPGHIVTIEPGIYIPGFGGVRIEDYALVTEKGCRVLSKSPKDLTVLKG